MLILKKLHQLIISKLPFAFCEQNSITAKNQQSHWCIPSVCLPSTSFAKFHYQAVWIKTKFSSASKYFLLKCLLWLSCSATSLSFLEYQIKLSKVDFRFKKLDIKIQKTVALKLKKSTNGTFKSIKGSSILLE